MIPLWRSIAVLGSDNNITQRKAMPFLGMLREWQYACWISAYFTLICVSFHVCLLEPYVNEAAHPQLADLRKKAVSVMTTKHL